MKTIQYAVCRLFKLVDINITITKCGQTISDEDYSTTYQIYSIRELQTNFTTPASKHCSNDHEEQRTICNPTSTPLPKTNPLLQSPRTIFN